MNTNKPQRSAKSGLSSRSNWVFKSLILLLILSRLLLLARYPFFYDAPEYLRLANLPSWAARLAQSHDPVHPLYLFLIGHFNNPLELSLLSALFGLGGVLVFLALLKQLFGQKVATRTLPFLILFPHLWLIQTNILHESQEQFFLILAFWALSRFFRSRRRGWIILFNVAIFLSLFTFLGIAVWFPILLLLVYYLAPRSKRWQNVGWFALNLLTLLILSLVAYRLILPSSHFHSLTQDYLSRELFSFFSPLNFLRASRNAFWLLWFGFTPVSFYLLWASFSQSVQKKNWLFFVWLTTLLIFVFTSSFWYGGLYGRFGSFFGYFLALWAALYLNEKTYSFAVGVACLFFLATLWSYQQTPLPTRQMALIREITHWRDSYFVVSDYQRPQLEYEGLPRKKMLVILDNDQANRQTLVRLEELLRYNQKIYFTEQSLTFPYLQNDGQSLHPIGRARSPKAKLTRFSQTHRFLLIKSYPQIPSLNLWLLSGHN